MVEAIREELPHFAYYLATQIKQIDMKQYVSNESQKDDDYYDFMRATVDPMHQLVEAVEEANLEKFIHILQEEFFVPTTLINKLFDQRLNKSDGRCILYNTLQQQD